jgi:hypothetical protein
MDPQIISSYVEGRNFDDFNQTLERLDKEKAYKDLSCIVVIPALGTVPTKAVASWWNIIFPPNQKVAKIFAVGMEVGTAYSDTIAMILTHPDLSTWKYLITIEHDNIIPQDGALKLLARMEEHPEFDCISGLYFTKGEGGQPQIWGNTKEFPMNFKPQPPVQDKLIECNGVGMGFSVWRLDTFKNPKLEKPWFKTIANKEQGVATQDLYFWSNARKHGLRCAVDCSVLVGHYSINEDIVW